MAAPIVVEIPHSLGKAEAKRRLQARIAGLASRIPGGAEVASSWPSDDRMMLDVRAMGQSIVATLDVEESLIRATIRLPMMLSLMGKQIAAAVRDTGSRMLLSDDRV